MTRSNRVLIVAMCGAVLMIAWGITDTILNRNERELLADLARSLEYTESGILKVSDSGIIVSWSKSCETLTGWTADEALGQSLTLLVPPAMHEKHRTGFAGAVAKKKNRASYAGFEMRIKDGTTLNVIIIARPIMGDGFVCVIDRR